MAVVADPYILAWRRETSRRIGVEGATGLLRRAALPVLATVILIPLVRQTFLAFLDDPSDLHGAGVVEVVFRAELVTLSIVVLDLYGRVVRGRERRILEIWPVDPAAVVRATLLAALVERAPIVVFGGVVLVPLATDIGVATWAAAVVALAATLVLSAVAGAGGHLLAVVAAGSDRLAPLLDLVRGNNPRAQAAFLYAPGLVLLAVGGLLRFAAEGAGRGDPVGLAWAASPLVAAAALIPFVPGLARRAWFRASSVLAEIDARYASLADPEEARRVYLEWAVRLLPVPARVYALDDLRHGWRDRRTPIGFGFVAGLLALAASWTTDPSGPWRATVVAIVGAFVVSANGVLLDADEPELLRVWMPRDRWWGGWARVAVLVGWSAPPMVAGAIGCLVRHGAAGALQVVLGGGIALLAAAVTAVGCGRLRERGLAVYAPLAAVAGGLVALAAGAW